MRWNCSASISSRDAISIGSSSFRLGVRSFMASPLDYRGRSLRRMSVRPGGWPVSAGGRLSAPLELRFAFFEEGGDPLGIIGAAPGGLLAIALHVQLLIETVGRRRLNQPLG